MTAKVLSSLLKGKHDFCCLCFLTVGEDALCIHDEVIVNFENNKTEAIVKILEYVVGDKFSNNVASQDVICNTCLKQARDSYKFIKMCNDNSQQLSSITDTLAVSLDNTSDDLRSFTSLFMYVKTKDISIKQYYDSKRTVTNTTTALRRFYSLAHGKYKRQKKSSDTKEHRTTIRTRIHNYREEMSEICEIIRESNHSKFKCRVCNGVFNKSFNFKKHYYSQHSAKDLQCSECGKCYGSEALLKQHKYDSHACITCSLCGKTYKNRYSLLYHMRGHSGDSPYKCQYCDMKFKWSSRRAEHIRRYHLEPSVECNICHSMFRSLGSLYEHRKRHFNPNSRLHVTILTSPVAAEEIISA